MILLTGGNGFLGKTISEYFSKRDLKCLGRRESDIICDLAFDVPDLSCFDLVIHAAGKAHVLPKTQADRKEFFDVNVKGTQNLLLGLEKANSLPKAFVFISSVSVYGVYDGLNIDEKHPLKAEDAYGLSKIQAEKIVEDWCAKHNIVCGILRLPLLVGAKPPGNLASMIKGIKKGYYFNIAEGKAKKSMVMAIDVARIIPKLAEVGGTYNLTDGYHPSFNELSGCISRQLGKKQQSNIPVVIANGLAKIGDFFPKFPLNSVSLDKITSNLTFNDDKARVNLGWAPSQVLESFKI